MHSQTFRLKIRAVLILFVASVILFRPFALAQGTPTPEWIWHDTKGTTPADQEVVFFRKTFEVSGRATRADLTAAADNHVTIYVNGQRVLQNDEWSKVSRSNVAALLVEGENVIAARGQNELGEAAILVRLQMNFAGGRRALVVSDNSWTTSKQETKDWETKSFAAQGWTKAVSKGKVGVAPWGNVLAPPVTLPSALTMLPGFKAELIRTAQYGEGSWVSMAIDNKGRLIISPQEGTSNLLRVTLTSAGQVEKVEPIELPAGAAMGMLYAFDSLYLSGRGPQGLGVYRLRDTNGDDKFDEVKLLKLIEGAAGEHGSHALILGPDQKIYFINGNFTKVPKDISPYSAHKNFAEDQLLPRMEDGNGFGVGIKPPGGFVLRTDSEGKSWELYTAGMRNTYDFAFNPEREMFGFDSDMEWDWGTPWYRPIRILHLVSGGDYGFREGTGKWPGFYPDSLPAVADVGIGSPTGVRFGTGAKFPEKYQKALYAMDWSYGRIMAVHLTPDGSSYRGSVETFLRGKPLNVTDMEVGLDGAMYFIIGGRNTQSALYRVTYTGSESTAKAVQDEKGTDARALRRKLEAFHGKRDAAAVNTLWPHLGSKDRFVRYAARVALESQDASTWQTRALEEENLEALHSALLALARVGDASVEKQLIAALGKHSPADMTEAQQLDGLRILEVAMARMGRPDDDFIKDIIESLDSLYPSKSIEMNRELSQVLIYLGGPSAIQKTLGLLAAASTQEEQIHYMVHLRRTVSKMSPEQQRQYFSWFSGAGRSTSHPATLLAWFKEAGRDYDNGASFPRFIESLRKDAVANLTDDQRVQLAPLITGRETSAKPALVQRAFVRDWKMDELLPALNEVASGRSFQKGRDAFAAAQCLACHRFQREGGDVGPDLTAVSSRFNRRDILESTIDPSKVISEQYQNSTITLKNGDDITGRVVEENDNRLVLLTNPLLGTRSEVKKADVAKREPAKLSAMPQGLVNILTKDEILDLLAYIESGGRETATFFKK